MNLRLRFGLAVLALAATGALYAEGVIKTGWIEAALVIPIGLSLVAHGSLARFLPNVLIFIMAISFSLTLLDLILRPTLGPRLHYTPTNFSPHRYPELPIVARWDADQTLDMESYGDLAAMVGYPALQERRRIVFRTDEFGFRNRPQTEPADVLILGDSYSAGAGTTDEETYARLLESHYGYHTYNLSYPGGPYEQFITFAIEWPRLKVASRPRMIWTFYTGNDMDDVGGETWDLSHLPWRHGIAAWQVKFKTYRNRSPLNQWMEALRIKFKGKPTDVIVRSLPNGQPILFFKGQEIWGNQSRTAVEQHSNFEKLKRTLAAMRQLTTERHVDVTVLILPTKGEVYRWLLEARKPQPEDAHPSGFALAILDACKTAQIVCHDTKAYLVSEALRLYDTEGKLLWWRDDTHIGTYGHRAIASYIADRVLNN
jgi:hypothetical protein